MTKKIFTLFTIILLASFYCNKKSSQVEDLQIIELKKGTGESPVKGDRITVHYKGTFTDGKEFDSSFKRNKPFTFRIGMGQVIKGWDQGFIGMKVGGKRKLIIPPGLAYGSRRRGSIPANSTLIFEVELLKVEH